MFFDNQLVRWFIWVSMLMGLTYGMAWVLDESPNDVVGWIVLGALSQMLSKGD